MAGADRAELVAAAVQAVEEYQASKGKKDGDDEEEEAPVRGPWWCRSRLGPCSSHAACVLSLALSVVATEAGSGGQAWCQAARYTVREADGAG